MVSGYGFGQSPSSHRAYEGLWVREWLSKEYLHPFDAELDTSFLYNLSSGTPIEEEIQPRTQDLSSWGAKTLVDAGHVIC